MSEPKPINVPVMIFLLFSIIFFWLVNWTKKSGLKKIKIYPIINFNYFCFLEFNFEILLVKSTMGIFKFVVESCKGLESKTKTKLSNPFVEIDCKLDNKTIFEDKSKNKRKTVDPIFDFENEIKVELEDVKNDKITLILQVIHFDPLETNLPLG